MRRSDRQVTDESLISQIFTDAQYINLGFVDDDGYAYILPLNYGYEEKDGVRTLYFHSAKEGKKIGLIEQGKCSFELVTGDRVYGEEGQGCTWASAFRCIMGHGDIGFVTDEAETMRALDAIMRHYQPGKKFEYNPAIVKMVTVYKMTVKDLTCKEHK